MRPLYLESIERYPKAVRIVALCLISCIVAAKHANTKEFESNGIQPSDLVRVGNAPELEAAIARANKNGGHAVIELSSGVYSLTQTLSISAPRITLRSTSGNAADVVITGDGMSATARIGNLIRVSAPKFALSGISLERSGKHLVQIAGESKADDVILKDCILRDAFEQMIKVSIDERQPHVTSDRGLIENCLFEYTAGIGPQFYIGGIDAHGAKQWTVRKNIFRNIASPSKAVAEFAIHFWSGSADNLIENNFIVDCDRGIGFGLDGRPNQRGMIRNNIILHTANTHAFADVGIALLESPDTIVHNNTILFEHRYPWSIEYRFRSTRGVKIFNNLSNRPITARNGANARLKANFTHANRQMFYLDARGIPRLLDSAKGIHRGGLPVSGFTKDFFGQPRSESGDIDIGAEEWSGGRS